MNDDLMFDYLVQMGLMRPEEAELKRQQAQVDALRQNSMTSPQGQMVGKHYVAPSLTQFAAQLANASLAKQGQQKIDDSMRGFNKKQADMLEEMRRRKYGTTPGTFQGPSMASDYDLGVGGY